MRRRLIAVGALVVGVPLLAGCAGDDRSSPSVVEGLETQTVQAGEVEIEVRPVRLDGGGAEFDLTLDTHAVDLDMDIPEAASLQVDGRSWPVADWEGDPPGGHHREGTVAFTASGPATGEVVLQLGGFEEPVEVAWRSGTTE